jgi:hypothetical protein
MASLGDDFWKWFTFIFVAFLTIGILINASGASTIMGTFFKGTTQVGQALEA